MDHTIALGVVFCSSTYLSTKFLSDMKNTCRTLSLAQRTTLWGINIAILLQVMFGTAVLFLSSFSGGMEEGGWTCNVDAFVTSSTTFAVINLVALLCYISNNNNNNNNNTSHLLPKNVHPLLLLVCWGIPVLLSSLPFMGIGKYIPHGHNTFCCLDWRSEATQDRIYFYTMFIIQFLIPSLFILYHGTKHRNDTTTTYNNDTTTYNNDTTTYNNDGQPVNMIFHTALLFLTLWLPYGVTTVHSLLGHHIAGQVEFVAVVCGLCSFVVLPLLLSQWLLSTTPGSVPSIGCSGGGGYDFRSIRVCLHFLLFL